MARMKQQFEFLAGIYLGDELLFNKYSLLIDFFTLGDSPENQNIALDRMNYFVYDILQRSVFISEDDDKAISNFAKAGVPLLTVPAGPIDPIVLAAISVKMNAIAEDHIEITDSELTSYVGGGLQYIWDPVDEDDEVHVLVGTGDETKWWEVPAPRFTSLVDGKNVVGLDTMTWEKLKLDWVGDDAHTPPKGKKTTKGTIIKADFTGDK